MKDQLGEIVIYTLASCVELSDLVDCVEESRVLILFRDPTEVRIERFKLPLLREALNNIA